MSALLVGLPLGGLSALILVPLARELSGRLMTQYAATDVLPASLNSQSLGAKYCLDMLLVGGLCLCDVLAVLSWGVSWQAWMAASYCAILQVLARIDVQTRLLPDRLTLPLLWAGLLFHWSGGWVELNDAVAGAAASAGPAASRAARLRRAAGMRNFMRGVRGWREKARLEPRSGPRIGIGTYCNAAGKSFRVRCNNLLCLCTAGVARLTLRHVLTAGLRRRGRRSCYTP